MTIPKDEFKYGVSYLVTMLKSVQMFMILALFRVFRVLKVFYFSLKVSTHSGFQSILRDAGPKRSRDHCVLCCIKTIVCGRNSKGINYS